MKVKRILLKHFVVILWMLVATNVSIAKPMTGVQGKVSVAGEDAAQYVSEHENCQMVQMVSFGCGVDAITSDETRRILEENGKLYTQLKIDEINNLGTVKIRLRSLVAALEGMGG